MLLQACSLSFLRACSLPWTAITSASAVRNVRVVPADANPAVSAFKAWRPEPLVVDFEVDRDEAVARFEQHQSAQCRRLHAKGLLKQPSAQLLPFLLPYWLFDAEIKADCRATLGFLSNKEDPRSERVWKEMDDWKALTQHRVIPHTSACMQVYASYVLRRDLAEGAKLADPVARGRAMMREEAETLLAGGTPGAVQIQAPHMKQSVAWQLAYRGIMHDQIRAAEEWLRAETGAAEVREVKLALKVLRRSARLVYLPAWVADYSFGERHTPGKDIVPETFQALIGGARGSGVVAEAHFSPIKAQLTTASTVGATVMAGGPLAAPLMGMDPLLGLGGVDILFWAFLSASAAGVLVRKMPQTKRNQHMGQQVRAELEFYRRYDAHDAQAPTELSDDHTQWLWMDADWRKWEGEDPWNWKEEHRRAWAESLLLRQARRARQRQQYKRRLERERQRQMEDFEREAKKQRQFGARQGPHYGGAEHFTRGDAPETPAQRRRARDFLGYYRLLGLDAAEEISTEDVKAAFKKVALQLHPDRARAKDEAAVQRSQEAFIKVQLAYEVLRDPDRRRLYDRGQLTQ